MPDPLKPQAASVRSGYDRWAASYDREANPLIAIEEPVVREAIGDVAGLEVLDLGCGPGVDFSEGMLEEARGKPGADAVRFLAQDLHQPLPFAVGSFDLVVSGLVLEHLGALDAFFAEARRVLRPGGRAVVSAMHPAMFLKGVQARFTDPASGEKVQPGSFAHSIGEFVMAALRAGFAIEGIDERAPDADFAARLPRAEKYVDWPMLVVLKLRAEGA